MFEAYKVAVKLSLVNDVSSGLIAMAGQFQSLNRHLGTTTAGVKELETRMANLKKMAIGGGALLGAGAFGLSALSAPLEAAKAYELAYTKFKTMNLGDSVNKQADQFARSASLMAVSGKELMNTLSESVGLFGNFDMAKRVAPTIAMLNKANSAIFQGKIDHMDEGSTRGLMKFIDRRGGTHDEATFMRNLDLAQKIVTGSGGFTKFRDLDQFSQHGGTAFRALSDEGILNMALLMQEQGGARAGTALMSGYQNLIAGRGTKASMHEAVKLGLGKLVEESIGSVGGKTQTRSRFVPNADFEQVFSQNPAQGMRQFILPAIDRMAGGHADDNLILKIINAIFSNRNASGQQSIMGTQQVQLIRDANLAKNAMGTQQTLGVYNDDPNSKFANLTARWADTMRELGTIILPSAIAGVKALSSLLSAIRDTAREFPVVTKGVVLLGVALSGLAVAGGGVMLLKAGIGALSLALGSGGAGAVAGTGLVGGLTAASVAVGALAGGLSLIVGLVAGSWLKKKLDEMASNDAGHETTFGADLYERLHGERSISGAPRKGKPDFVQPGYKRPYEEKNGNIYIDGRKVGEIVSSHQGGALNKPSTGSRVIDGSMSLRALGAH